MALEADFLNNHGIKQQSEVYLLMKVINRIYFSLVSL